MTPTAELSAEAVAGLDTRTPEKIEIDRLRAELDHFTRSGVVEIAVRNPSVAEYMAHWEDRATKAESALREAVAAERERWQPIETAPKDGTLIWLGSAHGSMRVGFWEDGAQHENYGTVGGGWRDFYRIKCDGQRDTLWPVVWWHPLPSPPAILSEDR